MRIEDNVANSNSPQVVTARAVSSLSNLLQLCQTWLSGDAIGLFHKGRDYQREIQESHDKWRYNLIKHQSDVSNDSVILEISNLSGL